MKKIITQLLFIVLLSFSLHSFAASQPPKGLNLYEKPDEKSKVLETISPGTVLVPIIREKNWTKVGDTKTGTVGWVNETTLKEYGAGSVKTITKSFNTPQGQGYQVVQYNSQQLDQKQVEELMQNWKTTQENLNRSFNQMMNQSLYNLNQMLQQFNREQAQHPLRPLPVTQPIILVPNNQTPPAVITPEPQSSVIAPAQPAK